MKQLLLFPSFRKLKWIDLFVANYIIFTLFRVQVYSIVETLRNSLENVDLLSGLIETSEPSFEQSVNVVS